MKEMKDSILFCGAMKTLLSVFRESRKLRDMVLQGKLSLEGKPFAGFWRREGFRKVGEQKNTEDVYVGIADRNPYSSGVRTIRPIRWGSMVHFVNRVWDKVRLKMWITHHLAPLVQRRGPCRGNWRGPPSSAGVMTS